MRRSRVLLALLVVSAVSVLQAGEAFAQIPTPEGTETVLLESAETKTMNTVELTFREQVGGVEDADFRVDGLAVQVSASTGTTITLTLADTDSIEFGQPGDSDVFETDATPQVTFTGNGVFTTDADDDKVQTRGSIRAADGLAPTMTGAKVTGSNQVTVTYSEAVTGDLSDYTNLRVGNPLDADGDPDRGDTPADQNYVPRNITGIRGFGTDTHTITFFGAPAATNALAQIDVGGVEDASPRGNVFVGVDQNNQPDGSPGQEDVVMADGQAPGVESVTVTGPLEVTVQWSETVTTEDADYVNLRINGARNVTHINGQAAQDVDGNPVIIDDQHKIVLTFGGSPVNTSATGVITINPVDDTAAGNRTGADTNTSARQSNIIVEDGQAPSLAVAVDAQGNPTSDVDGLKITGPNTVTLAANEAVSATTRTFSDLTITQDGIEEDNPRRITDVDVRGAAMTITFAGDGVAPDAAGVMTIENDADDNDALVDLAGNLLADIDPDRVTGDAANGTLPVRDGQAPTLRSIGITASDTITAEFSEAVTLAGGVDHFENFRIAGERGVRAIDSATASGNVVTLTFAGADLDGDPNNALDGAPVGATGTIRIGDTITDAAGNNFAGVRNAKVEASQAPSIESIKFTGPETITVEFSEGVEVTGANDFQNLRLRGESLPRDIEGAQVDQNDNTVVTVTFDADEDGKGAPTDATATITVNDSIRDTVGTPFVARQSVPVADGQAPELDSIKITGPNTITAVFSEAVDAEQDRFEELAIGTDEREITGFDATPATYTMEFAGPAADPDGSGTIDILEGIADAAGNEYAGADGVAVADGQAPTLKSIGITDSREITAVFSEAVTATRDGFVAFQVLQDGASVGDYRNIGVVMPDQNRDPLQPTDRVVLAFSGRDVPLDATGRINITGDVRDGAKNEFAAMTGVTVLASQIPHVTDANITGPGTATIVFSEPLSAAAEENFAGLTIDGETVPRTITSAVLASDTVTITFETSGPDGDAGTDDDNPAPTDATATVGISGVKDTQGNVMEPVPEQAVGDRQSPTVNVSVTGHNTVTAVFSEAVDARQGDFDRLRIDDNGNITNREITLFERPSETAYAMTFDGAAVAGNANGTIDIGDAITDAAGNEYAGADGVAGEDDVAVADGQAPTLLRAEFLEGAAIGLAYSEPVISSREAYTELLLSTGPDDYRNVIHSGTGTSLIFVSYSGVPAGDDVTATINISDSIRDGPVANSGLGLTPVSAEVFPRSAPTLVSAEITGPNEITAAFSEPVDARQDDFDDLRITGESIGRKITEIAGSKTETITITFSGRAVDAGATGQMDVVGGEDGIRDLVGGALATLEDTAIGAGQNPTLTSAMVTGPNTITLEFSEAVMYAHNVIISELFSDLMLYPGGDRDIEDIEIDGSAITITFGGDGVDTDATGSMNIGGGLTDTEGNPFAGSDDVTIQAGQPARMTSVSIASDGPDPASAAAGDTVTITFTASEPIARPDVTIHGSPADRLTNPADNTWVAARTMQAGDSDGTVTFTIDFDGQQASSTTDGSSVAFNVAPVFDSAAVTGHNTITVAFSKAVNASPSDFANLVLTPGGARTVTGAAGTGTDTIAITFGGAASPTDATASLTLGSGIADLAGTALAGPLSVTASDGQAPTLESVSIASDGDNSGIADVGDTVTLTFTASEAVTDVTVMIDGTDTGTSSTDSVTWTALKTIATTDLAGAAVVFTIDFTDMASNAGAQVTSTTDGSSVTIAETDALTGTVTGTVFTDTDGNGVMNSGEAGIQGYTMIAIDTVTNQLLMTDTAADGTYTFESINANTRFLIQTGFFPPGHTVVDVASSWFTYVELEAGGTETFDVGFYPVPQVERTTLNLTVYHDANINGVMDAGESGVSGAMLTVYTYTIGPEIVTTDANGQVTKTDLVPADWAITTIPEGYLPTTYSYERDDSTAGKVYDPAVLVADDPEPGSIHTMMIGVVPAS